MEVQIQAEDTSISHRLPISSKYTSSFGYNCEICAYYRRRQTYMSSPLKILGLNRRITSTKMRV